MEWLEIWSPVTQSTRGYMTWSGFVLHVVEEQTVPTVSVRCSVPGGVEYHMMYCDLTVTTDDYPQLSGISGDDKIRCMEFLATRQIFLWQVAIGFLPQDQFQEKMKVVEQLIPKVYRDAVLTSQKETSSGVQR